MALRHSKRAVFFSLIAVMMSVLFILLFSGASHVALDERAKVVSYDVLYINQFIGELDRFVESSSRVTSAIVLDALAVKSPVPNATESFLSCFMNSTYFNGTDIVECHDLGNVSFPAYFNSFVDLAQVAYDIEVNLTIVNVTFRQVEPYFIENNITCVINVTHLGASWTRYVESSQEVSIIGLQDPLLVNTPFNRSIRWWDGPNARNQEIYFIQSNYSKLERYASNGFYIRDRAAPSYIDMLEGTLPDNGSGYEFNTFGLASFIPDNATPYIGNRSSWLSYHYTAGFTFDSFDLKRINFTGIGTNFSLPIDYLKVNMDAYSGNCPGGVDPEIFNVTGCCFNNSGCDPNCGAPPPCLP